MPKVTPVQKLRLQHRYDIDPAETYAVMCDFDGHLLEATEYDAVTAQQLIATLLRTALAAQRTKPQVPNLKLAGVYTVDADGGYDPVASGWDIHNQHCLDCGENTCVDLGEYYMVTDALWAAHVPEGADGGMICIGCLEGRLGRLLTRADFADVPLNRDDGWYRSERLAARLATAGDLTPIR